jgi:hypothetical protein
MEVWDKGSTVNYYGWSSWSIERAGNSMPQPTMPREARVASYIEARAVVCVIRWEIRR